MTYSVLILSVIMKVSFAKDECCANPVEAFRLNDWAGPCASLNITQKWERYKDWVEMNNGYINPHITFDYVDSSFNRGVFSTHNKVIPKQIPLMQLPWSISLTQFSISKYIKNDMNSTYFSTKSSFQFLPSQFPDSNTFLLQLNKHHDKFKGNFTLLPPSIAVWMALGLSWIKKNTNDLLPWLSLLPTANYLPFLFEDKEYLFKDTEVDFFLQAMEYDFILALKYLDILHVDEESVRQLCALIYSRAYQIDFSHIGGLKSSPAIPVGADFFNHNMNIHSEFPFYDELFGDHYYGNIHRKAAAEYHQMSYAVPEIAKFIGKDKVKKTDFWSSYYFVTYPIFPTTEILGSYGDNHPSHVSMALYGFIEDEMHGNDFINIGFRNYNDEKYQYFNWNKILLLKFAFSYTTLHFSKDLQLSKDFQLLYLPIKYMDSFTISAIKNGFEWKYISNVLAPIIEREIRWFCYDKLTYFYPTRMNQDYNDLKMIKKHLKFIQSKLKDKSVNLSRNRKEKLRLQSILNQVQKQLTITRYTLREKQFYVKCTKLKVLFQ